MTKVLVNAGICGHEIGITVYTLPDSFVRAKIETSCPNISKIPQELLVFDPITELFQGGNLSSKLKEYTIHQSCVFISALLKAAEAEAGLALKKDVFIKFVE
jgi:hypothetical protein